MRVACLAQYMYEPLSYICVGLARGVDVHRPPARPRLRRRLRFRGAGSKRTSSPSRSCTATPCPCIQAATPCTQAVTPCIQVVTPCIQALKTHLLAFKERLQRNPAARRAAGYAVVRQTLRELGEWDEYTVAEVEQAFSAVKQADALSAAPVAVEPSSEWTSAPGYQMY
jgi:hypothetical protein